MADEMWIKRAVVSLANAEEHVKTCQEDFLRAHGWEPIMGRTEWWQAPEGWDLLPNRPRRTEQRARAVMVIKARRIAASPNGTWI